MTGDGEYYVTIRRDVTSEGTAGASAQRVFEQRHQAQWAKGARGEEAVGRVLDRLTARGVVILHDRRVPGSRANIDHLAISRDGVFVIDAKHYRGRVEQRGAQLFVNRRRRTKLIDGLATQVSAVENALNGVVPVHRALCFVGAQWPLFRRPLDIDGTTVLWPEALESLVWRDGWLTAATVQAIARVLVQALPPA
jgi:hypothetical protein